MSKHNRPTVPHRKDLAPSPVDGSSQGGKIEGKNEDFVYCEMYGDVGPKSYQHPSYWGKKKSEGWEVVTPDNDPEVSQGRPRDDQGTGERHFQNGTNILMRIPREKAQARWDAEQEEISATDKAVRSSRDSRGGITTSHGVTDSDTLDYEAVAFGGRQ